MELRRNPIPKRLYTPTQETTDKIVHYYLLFFCDTESYQIVTRSSIRKFDNEGFAIITIREKSMRAKVICSGSLDTCEFELTRRTRLSQQSNNDVNLNEDRDIHGNQIDTLHMLDDKQQSIFTQPKFQTTFNEPISYEENIYNGQDPNDQLYCDDISTKKKSPSNKRKQTTSYTGGKRKRYDNIDIDNTRTVNLNNDYISILETIGNKFSSLESKLIIIDNKISDSIMKINKKIDYLTASSISNKVLVDAYKDEAKENFTTEVMYGEINLLHTLASSVGDFARKTMKLVFTQEELKTHVLPPARSHLSRPSLDEQKFQCVNEAIRVKFKLDSTKYSVFYKNILRRKLSDFLIEERRRESNKRARHLLKTTLNTVLN